MSEFGAECVGAPCTANSELVELYKHQSELWKSARVLDELLEIAASGKRPDFPDLSDILEKKQILTIAVKAIEKEIKEVNIKELLGIYSRIEGEIDMSREILEKEKS